MSRVFDAARWLWLEAQLRAPGWANNRLIPFLHEVKDAVRDRPYATMHHLRGHNAGGALAVDYAGLDHLPALTTALFSESPKVGAGRRLGIDQIAQLSETSNADLLVVAGGKRLIGKLPRERALLLPFLVTMTLDVSGSWEDVQKRVFKTVHRHEFRLYRKHAYEYHVSRRDEDFELFYHNMYVPTILLRKADLAQPMPRDEAYHYFQRGALLQMIQRDGRYVAGALSYAQGHKVKFHLLGTLDADETLMLEGALGACYYSIVHWSNQAGYRKLVFGDCVPRLSNGVLQYKRKWGSTLTISDRIHKRFWIRVLRDTPAVRRFFKDNPLITLDPHGQLHSFMLGGAPDLDDDALRREYETYHAMPGLSGLQIRTMDELLPQVSSVRRNERMVSSVS